MAGYIKRTTIALTLVVAAFSCLTPAWAEPMIQKAKLLADDGAARDYFGGSVSLDGDTVVVGAFADDDNGDYSGSAYVVVRSGGVWTQQAKLVPDDGAAGDWFGSPVSLDGDTVVIGASQDDDNGANSGSAYVFIRSGGVWAQEAKLLPADGAAYDQFGLSVSLDGDTVVVSASGDDDNGRDSGSAYVFVRSGGVWTQQAKLVPDDGAADDGFGSPVSLDGDTVVIGASQDDDNDDRSGSAYVFVRSAGVWIQQAKLLADDGRMSDEFGRSVALDDDTVVVSAWRDDDSGHWSGSAYVFVRSGGVWAQVAKLLADDGAAGDGFGSRVSLDGDTVVVGAYDDDDNGEESGSAYLFVRSRGRWTQQAKLLADDGAGSDYFGLSVSLDGDTVVIGASHDDDSGENSGAAYVFTRARVLVNELIDALITLNLRHGIENSLDAKLEAAMQALADGNANNDVAAINTIGAFIHAVEVQGGRYIPEADADLLIAAAQEIIDLLVQGLAAPPPVQVEVTLCHIPPGNPSSAHTNQVAQAEVPAHMAHGDLIGECPYECGPASPVPQTGQTYSYGPRDDGELQMGLPSPDPRFTDNGDGTVKDNLTGLIWLQNANCWTPQNWTNALLAANDLSDGSCGLSDGSVAGDWRLPNFRELQSLIDWGDFSPALPPGHAFYGLRSYDYWSSTSLGFDYAWVAYFFHGGYVDCVRKSYYGYVWPVRGGQ